MAAGRTTILSIYGIYAVSVVCAIYAVYAVYNAYAVCAVEDYHHAHTVYRQTAYMHTHPQEHHPPTPQGGERGDAVYAGYAVAVFTLLLLPASHPPTPPTPQAG